jgi:hypothetical protein
MGVTYAVSWEEPDGSPRSGRLELGTDALLLEGRNGGAAVTRAFPYKNMSGLRVARAAHERLGDRPTLIVDLVGGRSLRIAGVAQPGIVSELASRLSALRHDRRLSERLALVVPLKPGSRPKAESLLAKGPPFDPAGLGLESHEVFLTDDEVVFVFEGVPGVLLTRSAENETIWDAAEAWEPLVEGSIRFAERVYAWPN